METARVRFFTLPFSLMMMIHYMISDDDFNTKAAVALKFAAIQKEVHP